VQLIDIILVLYILLVIIGLLLLWQKLSETLSKLNQLTPEQRILIIVTVYAIITFAAFFVGLKIYSKRTPNITVSTAQTLPPISSTSTNTTSQKTITSQSITQNPSTTVNEAPSLVEPTAKVTGQSSELQNFLQLNYPEFEQQRLALQQTIQRFDQFFKRADQLAFSTPRHWKFMQQIALNRWGFRQQLEVLGQKIDQEIQTFWIFYRTGSADYAQQEFSKKANYFTEDMQNLLGKESDVQNKDNKLIKNYIAHLNKILNNPPPKSNQISPQYTSENRQFIVQWMQHNNKTILLNNLSSLEDAKARIETSIYEFQTFLNQYPETISRIQPTLTIWKQASQANLYVQYRLLHCAEAILLLTDPVANIAPDVGESLEVTLIEKLPTMISDAADIRLQAERSYRTEQQKSKSAR
jgi:hypothetical protein